jgi:hypothetical protein
MKPFRDAMPRVLWLCWMQGWDQAPPLVRKCLASWQQHHRDWDVRALDLTDLRLLLDLPDLRGKQITPTSFSDLARIMLLHEFGGVWADATLLCRRPLESWLPAQMHSGFFAFDRPGGSRPLSSWFLAAHEGNELVGRWCAAVLDYWRQRDRSDDYFWFHHLFAQLHQRDATVRQVWARTPKLSAEPCHQVLRVGFDNADPAAIAAVTQQQTPMLKLEHRHDPDLLHRDCLLSRLINPQPDPVLPPRLLLPPREAESPAPLASLKVKTENLGDHVQILSARRVIERLWHEPTTYIDRDDEIASLPTLPPANDPLPIVMNGWFKTNRREWPPHPRLLPAFVAFHIRRHQCPELLAEPALAYYRTHGPVGCRDTHTRDLLREHGIDAHLTHCLTLTNPRRLPTSHEPDQVLVVSRDQRIVERLPGHLKNATFVCHYSGSSDFHANVASAAALLERYRSTARLIVTTLLHCALPAMAMCIPVVMIYPINSDNGHKSDRERLSSLAELTTIHMPDAATLKRVDWHPAPRLVGQAKLLALTGFAQATARWNRPLLPLPWSLAPADVLPVTTQPPRPAWPAQSRWEKMRHRLRQIA